MKMIDTQHETLVLLADLLKEIPGGLIFDGHQLDTRTRFRGAGRLDYPR